MRIIPGTPRHKTDHPALILRDPGGKRFTALSAAEPTLRALVSHAHSLMKVQRILEGVLPEELAQHLSVANVHQGTLVLNARSAIWCTKARFAAPQILEKLQCISELKGIHQIRIRLDPRTPEARDSHRGQSARHSAAGACVLRETAEHIGDDALKSALHRLASHVGTDAPD
ncbi:MAG: DUF721 domain-containing protein [Gammaproteobacteria bacterium]|nr:DUF721 domain-containing protein [Gammaproteobacteria bacterium]